MASYSGFWSDRGGFDNAGGATHTLLKNKSPNRYHLSRLLKTRGMREIAELIATIGGDSTPASSASVTISRVAAARALDDNVQGGVRTIESAQLVGGLNDSGTANTARVIAAADVTDMNLYLPGGTEANRAPGTYPTDASGNGGGGKIAAWGT